jgi:transposase InsO family protein
MTDNGSCYRVKEVPKSLQRTRPAPGLHPALHAKTNGKAERFIQTALCEWAYARAYHNSDQRSAELIYRLHRYNWHRQHGSLKAKTPISRLGLSEDNLLRLHS